MEQRLKVYLATSFVSCLTGRPTTREPVASWQAASRQWWAAVAPLCDLFVSDYVHEEAQKGNADQVAQELAAFQSVRDNYPKFLLTMDRVFAPDHNGVRTVNVYDFLLGKDDI